MKRVTISIFILFCLHLVSSAQDGFREEYENFRKQAISTYSDFRRECNDRYVEFMQYAWESYKASPAVPVPEEEMVPPVVINDDDRNNIKNEEQEVVEIIPAPKPEPQPMPVAPVKNSPVVPDRNFSFSFFGTSMDIRADESLKFSLKSASRQDVAAVWKKLSGEGYDNMLIDCLKVREEYCLCDWAYLSMLLSFSERFLGGGDESTILAAFLFSQSGYKMRLGLSKKGIALLYGTNHQVFDAPGYVLDGEYFYQANGTDTEMEIVNFSFPNEKPLSLAINAEPSLSVDLSDSRQLSSEKLATKASCSVNKNLVQFFSFYPSSQLEGNPLTRWALYANTPLDHSVKEQMYPSLTSAVNQKSKQEAVGILLDFVQTAFEYEYDDVVWGYDRAFFAEEALYYPYCDCEDRSILFSRLVRDLLGLDVVLVYYPGHLAAAVNFPDTVPGDYISLEGRKFIICDPTYIGAPIGMTMPGFESCKPRVILLN